MLPWRKFTVARSGSGRPGSYVPGISTQPGLNGEVTREVPPAPALDVVRVGHGEPGELLPHGLRALRAHGSPPQPVRDRVLEPARLRDPVDALIPDRQAVEVLAEDANVVHARLDRVQQRVEAARTPE